jgi:hypothetical protein
MLVLPQVKIKFAATLLVLFNVLSIIIYAIFLFFLYHQHPSISLILTELVSFCHSSLNKAMSMRAFKC